MNKEESERKTRISLDSAGLAILQDNLKVLI
jgi:hypothetical protein